MSDARSRFVFVNETEPLPSEILSVQDAADELHITAQRVRQLIAEGRLEATRVGHAWVIERRAVAQVAPSLSAATIAPIAAPTTSTSGLRVLSFFSGAMGLDLGLESAGLETVLACENDPAARATIAANRPDIPVLGDIWKYDAADVRALAGFAPDEDIDVVAGGPPCQAFSTAGARRGFDDHRGNVFLRFIELIKELNPKYAVIENVRGLLSMPAADGESLRSARETNAPDVAAKHGAIRLVVALLEEAGYDVAFNLYNAANFGAPQVRERVVLVCTRVGERVPYLRPTHSDDPRWGLPPWRTVQSALEGLDESDQQYVPFPPARLKYFRLLGPGQHWRHLPADVQAEAMGKSFALSGGRTGFYRRLAWNKPSPTLVTHPAMPATALCHPTQDRPLSVQEYKRIQQFPDGWMLQGRVVDQYRQVGNAVPLGLGAAIGRAITEHARGEAVEPPEGFRFSRYRDTSDREIAPREPVGV